MTMKVLPASFTTVIRLMAVGLGLAAGGSAVALASEGPRAVSPGATSKLARIADPCPTFSWGEVVGAASYEIVVYRLGTELEEEAHPVLQEEIVGTAETWTPSLDSCLLAGGRYAWSVRAVGRTEVSDWSAPSLFEVVSQPNGELLELTLEAVRDYLAMRERREQEEARDGLVAHSLAPAVQAAPARGDEASARGAAPGGTGNPARLQLASPDETGLRSEISSTTGMTFGVHGVSNSSDDDSAGVVGQSTAFSGDTAGVIGQVRSAAGAAGVFENTAGGDILRGLNDGYEAFVVDGTGRVTANGFRGYGGELSGVTAEDLDGLDSTAFLEETELDSEAELEAQLSDVANVLTDSETAATATALAANGTDCAAGQFARGVDAAGNAELCGDQSDAHAVGNRNTRTGVGALLSNTSGSDNSANGYDALFYNTSGDGNTASGYRALFKNTTGIRNSAVGRQALYSNTTGSNNVAIGGKALFSTAANRNVGVGFQALYASTSGFRNVAVGSYALDSNLTGDRNAAVGDLALSGNTSGVRNTGIGTAALHNNTTGDFNIALGNRAGYNATSGDNNIFIGAQGVAGDATTIRIGTAVHTRTFIRGIRGVTTGNANAVPVLVDSAGQLGTVSSSRRFKKEIRDMDGASERLWELRPVTFKYRQEPAEGEQPLQFGLIAEEVAEILPDLVVYDEEGRPYTVRYHLLSSLLLNELQKQGGQLRRLRERLARLERADSPSARGLDASAVEVRP